MIVFGRQKDFRSSHPDNQRTLARLLNAAMCPVTVPEEGVVLVCSGSAQIAKLHTTKIKKRRGKQTTNRHTHEENRWMDRRQRDSVHTLCVLNSIRMKTSTIDHERFFFFFVCVYVTFYSSFQLFFCLFFFVVVAQVFSRKSNNFVPLFSKSANTLPR